MCRDLKNMLIASEAIARSALSRKESRGAHSRTDFPKMEAEWSKVNTSVFKKGDDVAQSNYFFECGVALNWQARSTKDNLDAFRRFLPVRKVCRLHHGVNYYSRLNRLPQHVLDPPSEF